MSQILPSQVSPLPPSPPSLASSLEASKRVAVVVFTMGGPDSLEAVQPFLFNLFSDPAILRVPGFLRGFLARLISHRRAPVAAENYRVLGGRSPLLENTRAQAVALADLLSLRTGPTTEWCVVPAMRYWHPLTEEALVTVKAFQPDKVVLLPLYPQWSTTTSASSLQAWHKACQAAGVIWPTVTIRSYPNLPGFIETLGEGIKQAQAQIPTGVPIRLLLTAHGLPESIVKAGDPYPEECTETVQALARFLGYEGILCYQSRVGPMKWIGPATEDELRRAGKERHAVILVPIAFVSEHSETLVELDIDYRKLAEREGVPYFQRVPTVGTHLSFIQGLADLVQNALRE